MDNAIADILETYKEVILQYLKTKNISIAYSANSEDIVDRVIPVQVGLSYGEFRVGLYHDFSVDSTVAAKDILTDCNICYLGDKVFIRIIMSFFHKNAHDFLIGRADQLGEILVELENRKSASIVVKEVPIIGIDLDYIKQETIDFLLDKDLRKYCDKHFIRLKRGLVFEGLPGTGKSLALAWLKRRADEFEIRTYIYTSVEGFQDDCHSLMDENKKLLIFEDFEKFYQERTDQQGPNAFLGQILNFLDGIKQQENFVAIFTTNQLNMFDKAFLRPGRIDKIMTFNIPTRVQQLDFFGVYLPDFKRHHEELINYLDTINCQSSYATLKGISDGIRLRSWRNHKHLDFKQIIDEVLMGLTKGNPIRNKMDAVL